MGSAFIERIVEILAYLYKYNGEFICDIAKEECYLWFNNEKQGSLGFEELDFLEYNEIIELDGGCDESGFETQVYRLTPMAQMKIKAILRDNKKLLLKDK